jgi:hypothetical protein
LIGHERTPLLKIDILMLGVFTVPVKGLEIKKGSFFVSFLNSITPYMKMILPPLEKGDRGGFFRWIAS